MNPRRASLEAIAHLPDEAMVPVGWFRDLLEDLADGDVQLHDLSVQEVAEQVGRKPSTIRTWLGAGKIPEAYRREGRDWRVPPAALRKFLDGQRVSRRHEVSTRPSRPQPLGAWRNHVDNRKSA